MKDEDVLGSVCVTTVLSIKEARVCDTGFSMKEVSVGVTGKFIKGVGDTGRSIMYKGSWYQCVGLSVGL